MLAPLRHRWTAALCLLALTSLTSMSFAQNVWTRHNDNNRTGWQANETMLSADPNSAGYIGNSKFGLYHQVYVGTQGEVDVYGLCSTKQNGCKP